jgi:hypothetical protein
VSPLCDPPKASVTPKRRHADTIADSRPSAKLRGLQRCVAPLAPAAFAPVPPPPPPPPPPKLISLRLKMG